MDSELILKLCDSTPKGNSFFLEEQLTPLTHHLLVDSSTVICRTSPFAILGVSGLFCCFYSIFHKILLANTVDPDQMPHDV